MAEFDSLLPYIAQIETLLNQKKSPRAVAKELGIPEKWMTINRYKKKYFNTIEAASQQWSEEQKKGHDERLAEGKIEIINTLEVLNLAKKRAKQLLNLEIGIPYETAEGETRTLSYGGAVIFWQAGQRMIVDVGKFEQELVGDGPESRKADALQELSDAQLRAIIEATAAGSESEPEQTG